MERIFCTITLLVGLILFVCVLVKYMHFRNTWKHGWLRFFKSFFRWYPLFRIYSTGSEFKRSYMKFSNRVNCFAWAAFLLEAIALLVCRNTW